MDLISVIVPVYRVQAYLDRCVQSIVDQTYQNLQIILVDDGSPDDCPALCDAWAEKDSRIRVIHQQNSGAGAARNAGLDAATGDCIAFVDSDDYLDPGMYDHLLELLARDVDIAECGYVRTGGDGAVFSGETGPAMACSTREAMGLHIRNQGFQQVIWNKLYRRGVIGAIRFPVGKQIDDEYFTYQVLGNARKLVRSDRVCYAYRQQTGSVMHRLSPAGRLQAVEAKAQRHEYLRRHFPDLEAESALDLKFSCFFQAQRLFAEAPGEREFLEQIRSFYRETPVRTGALEIPWKHRLWLALGDRAFSLTCWLRNLLRIGI